MTVTGMKMSLIPTRLHLDLGGEDAQAWSLLTANVFLMMAMSLAGFDLYKATDEAGIEITPLAEFISGMVRYVIRSRGHASFFTCFVISCPKPFP